jgi:hypothetical protein
MILQTMVLARKKINNLQNQLDMIGTLSQHYLEVTRNGNALSIDASLAWPKTISFLLGIVAWVVNVWGYVPKGLKYPFWA